AAAAVYKVVQARRPSPALPEGDAWPPTPRPVATPPSAEVPTAGPAAPKKSPPTKTAAENGAGWVEPVGGTCPATHPVKGKLTSLIYHLPGMTAYERTNADRCYRDEDAAQADGLRKAKR
ncbi:MAG: hypothetical protein M3Z84_04905, partial [Actinomycetota bacterium]|nr:hypothetical protein [Actinomycetota bacterium]